MPPTDDRPAGARLPPGAQPSPTLADARGRPASDRPIRITADIHEARSGIPDGLTALGATIATDRLAAGDYALGSGTLVERKRVMDLHTAIGNGRFWPQLLALRDACAHPYLLVEGTDIDRGPVHPASIRSLLLAVIAKGVPVLRSYQQKDSAIWIYRLALAKQRPQPRRDRPPYAQLPARRRPPDSAEALLAGVPGISVASARALLERFGTVAELVKAGPDGWREVSGIGPGRVQALERAFGGEEGGAAADSAPK